MTRADREEFAALARRLEARHDLFAAVWEMGRPEFSDEISTACVEFSSTGEWVRFLFNPDYWRSLDQCMRDFVVCHEVLHVVLAHGVRTTHLTARLRANIAADLVVNHLLVDRYEFVRERVRDWASYCWCDTVFETPWANRHGTLEGYYEALGQTRSRVRNLVDVHEFATRLFEENEMRVRVDRFHRDLLARYGTGVLDELAEGVEARQAGWSLGLGDLAAEVGPGQASLHWSAVLNRVLGTTVETDADSWASPHRRWAGLPIEVPGRGGEKRRKRLALFIDTSGSCWGERKRLVQVARSLEARAEVEAFAFDTEAVPLGPKIRQVWGGGGTDFRCIEACVAGLPRYPDAVVVLTDGAGHAVKPKHPRRWHWVLTESCRCPLPNGSHRHLLENLG